MPKTGTGTSRTECPELLPGNGGYHARKDHRICATLMRIMTKHDTS